MILSSDQITDLHNVMRLCGDKAMALYAQKDIKQLNDDQNFPVTQADKLVHGLLVAGLKKITPDIPVVSEEDDYNHALDATTYWLIDPIDGTKGFVEHSDEFTINAGLIVDGYPDFGMMYAPALRELFWGGLEYGAFKKEGFKPQHSISARTSMRDVVAIVRGAPHDKTNELLNKIGVSEKIHMDASLKFGRIAEGKAQIYIRYAPQHWWDVAAGQAIAEGAGATMINPETNTRFIYSLKKGTIITPLLCHSLGSLVEHILNPQTEAEENG